jgi:hypothetical protein
MSRQSQALLQRALLALAVLVFSMPEAPAWSQEPQPPQPLGPAFPLFEPGPNEVPFQPRLAVAPDGRFAAVWHLVRESRVGDVDTAFGQAFQADGSPLSPLFELAPLRAAGRPVIALRGSTEMIAVWEGFTTAGESAVLSRRFGFDGSPLAPEQEVAVSADQLLRNPSVAQRGLSGGFWVAWDAAPSPIGAASASVSARRLSPDGTPDGSSLLVSDDGSRPALAAGQDGGVIVSWIPAGFDPSFSNPVALTARRFDPAGQPVGAEVVLAEDALGAPRLLLDGGSVLYATWLDNRRRPTLRRLSPVDLTPLGPAVELSTQRATGEVALARVGDFLFAAWTEGETPPFSARGRFLSLSGEPVGEETAIETDPGFQQSSSPALAGNSIGRAVAAFQVRQSVSGYTPEGLNARLFQAPLICTPSATRLCLNGGRFAVEASWQTNQGASGAANAVPLTPDTGYFTFFDPDNVELVVKVLNACAPPFHRYWVFAAGLTNVQVDLQVIDLETGTVSSYNNPLSTPFEPILDTQAFATCP